MLSFFMRGDPILRAASLGAYTHSLFCGWRLPGSERGRIRQRRNSRRFVEQGLLQEQETCAVIIIIISVTIRQHDGLFPLPRPLWSPI